MSKLIKYNKGIRYVVAQPLIGGMPLGFEEAFGNPPSAIITAGFANDEHYIHYMNEVRKLNIPVINTDVDYETFKSTKDEELYNEHCQDVDVLMHVAICSGLSAMNASCSGSKARGCPDNDQNQNMYALTKLGMRMNAKVVAFENAPGAYTKSGKATMDRLVQIGKEHEYSTQLIKTDTLLHSVPQTRQRTFIMFYNKSSVPVFNYEKLDYQKLGDYLKNIPENALYQDIIPGKIDTPLYEFVLSSTNKSTFLEAVNSLNMKQGTVTAFMATEHIGFDKAMEYFKDDDKTYNVVKNAKMKKDNGLNYWDSTPYTSFRGDHTNAVVGKHIHLCINPNEERALNIRELLYLMGMPHDFEMFEPKKNWNHICQNVPVKTAKYIASEINKFLNNELELSNVNFFKQDNIRQKYDTPIVANMEEW